LEVKKIPKPVLPACRDYCSGNKEEIIDKLKKMFEDLGYSTKGIEKLSEEDLRDACLIVCREWKEKFEPHRQQQKTKGLL